MDWKRAVGAGTLCAGLTLLYVGLANAGGLVPPYALCQHVGDPTVHLGSNLALVYEEGCTPYPYAREAFAFVTVAGLVLVASGVRIERRHR